MSIQSLDRAELLALLGQAHAKRRRDWLMILLAFSHGLRATEVVGGWIVKTVNKKKIKTWYPGLTPGDFTSTHLTVQRLKGSLRTTQPMRTDENPLLDERAGVIEYIRKWPRSKRLFNLSRVRFWQIMQEHCAAAKIPEHKRHPHVLKHSIAMQTIQTAGIENVRQFLGHKSIGSTGAYLKVTDEDAAAAVERSLNV